MAPVLNNASTSASSIVPPNPRGEELNRVCIALTTTAAVLVSVRVAIRAKRKLLGLDDLWIGIALLFSVLLTISVAISVHFGYSLYIDQVSPEYAARALFWWYFAQVFYKCITWPTKISILLMYWRVFMLYDGKAYGVSFRKLLYGTFAVVVASFIAFETAGIFQCTPINRAWNHAIPGNCTSTEARFYAYAACNFVTDVIILALPMPLIDSLSHVTRRQKIALMGVFALGGFVCVTTLIRIDKLNMKADVLYSGRDSVLWSSVEANVGIICACLPFLRPLVINLFPCFAQRNTTNRHDRNRTPPANLSSSGRSRITNWSSRQLEDEGPWTGWEKDNAYVMSSITGGESKSRQGSEDPITDGIKRQVEVETVVESSQEQAIENELDCTSYKLVE